MRPHIESKRAELAAQRDAKELAYNRLEAQIAAGQQELALQQRDIDALNGAIQTLDQLLALPDDPPHDAE